MKKSNIFKYLRERCALKFKICLAMKLTVFLIMLTLTQTFAVESYSQATKLSLEMRSTSVREVLSEIETSTEFYFLYSSNVVDVDREVNLNCENQTIDKVLSVLFDQSDVKYDVYDRQIVLSVKSDEASAQQNEVTVSGVVTNLSGERMPGVTVVLRGTSQGVITDNDGAYTIKNVPADGALVFSFIVCVGGCE